MSPPTAMKDYDALITIDGHPYPTVADAARLLGVSTKAVNDYIAKGIIPAPPTLAYGLRDINIYPDEYMEVAQEHIRVHRRNAKASRRETNG